MEILSGMSRAAWSAYQLKLRAAACVSVASVALEAIALLGFLPPEAGRRVQSGACVVALLFLIPLLRHWSEMWTTVRPRRSVRFLLDVCRGHYFAGVIGVVVLGSFFGFGFGVIPDRTAWPARLFYPAQYVAVFGLSLLTSLTYYVLLSVRGDRKNT